MAAGASRAARNPLFFYPTIGEGKAGASTRLEWAARVCGNSSRIGRRRGRNDHCGAGCRVDARFWGDDRAVYATNSTTSAERGANSQTWLDSDERVAELWRLESCGPSERRASVANTKPG